MLRSRWLLPGMMALFALMLRSAVLHAQDYSSSDDSSGVDPTYSVDSESDQVLELPQVAIPNEDDSESTAADSADTTDSSDQVATGDLNDYEDQADAGAAVPQPAAPMVSAPPVAAFAEDAPPLYAPITPPVIIVARPGGLGPFPATSPMLTTPAGSHVITGAPAVAGGWWQRAHR
jgi:hypothetical protein